MSRSRPGRGTRMRWQVFEVKDRVALVTGAGGAWHPRDLDRFFGSRRALQYTNRVRSDGSTRQARETA